MRTVLILTLLALAGCASRPPIRVEYGVLSITVGGEIRR
jgi:uncharacterized protein YcfL